ncbi:tetratricopeptide repeat protein [Woodsholea maritima]|uniref:tetratricopeptide repeat protein n=1 Tax=Woodsholea maritima TaxID=240237 RepID=UPI0003699DCF|nr:tetratricopeptide repeat protein [Woodsholea maritima]
MKYSEKVQRLLSYLELDPDNRNLLSDVIDSALQDGHPLLAYELLNNKVFFSGLTDKEVYLSALCALQFKDYEQAINLFSKLTEKYPTDPIINFNLCYCCFQLGQYKQALESLLPMTTRSLPQAASLEVQLLHHSGELDLAMDKARDSLTRYPDYADLKYTTALLALDAEDFDYTRSLSDSSSEDHPTLNLIKGNLDLLDGDVDKASFAFKRALELSPNSPRALIGIGLVELLHKRYSTAGAYFDQAAQTLETHLGSWVAASWAYILNNDLETAERRLNTALLLDDTFDEIHGGLAVIDALRGEIPSAQRKLRVAFRLNPQSGAAQLASFIVLNQTGRTEDAYNLLQKALETDFMGQGANLTQMIQKFSSQN